MKVIHEYSDGNATDQAACDAALAYVATWILQKAAAEASDTGDAKDAQPEPRQKQERSDSTETTKGEVPA